MKTRNPFVLAGFLAVSAEAQSVLFDFNDAPVHTSLPINLTVGGITANFSATGPGFSIQDPVQAIGLLPAGFSGLGLCPNSINSSDLIVDFPQATLTACSILYAPQELACDSSATMRVTAYANGVPVGTNDTVANPPGTWPTGTLSISSAQGFNRVVVHYQSPPPTGGDYGRIFVADNMTVTPAPMPIYLTSPAKLVNGPFQLTFTNWTGLTFSAYAATNLTVPFGNWTPLGAVTEVSSGHFQFTDSQATNFTRRFYRISSP